MGDVSERSVFMADDQIDTGGTILSAAQLLREKGAREVYLACSLPFFNGGALERFDAAFAKGHFRVLIGTDAVFRGEK